jgi:DNA-3-methyladenine glycosylase I
MRGWSPIRATYAMMDVSSKAKAGWQMPSRRGVVEQDRPRCDWAQGDALLSRYHDEEWGESPDSDKEYFEAMMLEIFQAGLSWRTVLHRREGLRQAFAGFSIPVVANFTEHEVEQLMQDERIIRHRQKIVAAVLNARAFLAIQQHAGSFRNWLDAMPQDVDLIHDTLRPHLRFFGPTVCRSFLEAVGKIPPEHDPHCWKFSPD